MCDFSGSQGGIKTVIRIPPDQQVGDDGDDGDGHNHNMKTVIRDQQAIYHCYHNIFQESQSLVDIATHPLLAATSSVDRFRN